MALDLLMPKLGLTMSEGTLLEWRAAAGDSVRKGQVIYVVETDKIATEVEVEAAGTLAERLVEEGEIVAVGTVVGRLSTGGAEATRTPDTRVGSRPAPVAALEERQAAEVGDGTEPSQRRPDGARIIATPLARRLARDRGIDLSHLTGSGPRGRIKAVDVERAAAGMRSDISARGDAPAAEGSASGTRSRPGAIQAAMARRLAGVKHGVPHFYLSTEVEMTRLLALRRELNADPEMSPLTITHFVLAAVAHALADQPGINRVWDGDELITYASSDVGMAVETEKGLYVPIVRNAGQAGLDGIASSARRLVEKAREGLLTAAETTGAAISVSNAGMHDVSWLTSIINPGQSSILGVGSIRQLFRPDAEGAPALRNEMGLVFSGDHRVHTGVEGLTFLNRIKFYLETPMRLLRHRPESGS